jgi:hypothetical protein
LDLNAQECSADGKSKSTPIVGAYSPNIGPTCGDGMTCEPLPKTALPSESTLSVEGSHVRTLARQGTGQESKESEADCGPNTSALFARYDPATSSWRTSQRCLETGWEQFSATWPRAGLTLSGNAYRLRPLVPLISATGFGYLPTPDRSMGDLRGGLTRDKDALTCYRKVTTGRRPSGANIGSSLRWCPEYIREWLRTGGDINPEWIEVLMGFPIGWTAVADLETPSSQTPPNG